MKINIIILNFSFWTSFAAELFAQNSSKIETLLLEKDAAEKRIAVIDQTVCRELVLNGIQAKYVNDMDKRAKEIGLKRNAEAVLYDGDTVKVVGFHKEFEYYGSNILVKVKEKTTTVKLENLEFFVSAESQKILKNYFSTSKNQAKCNELREKIKEELLNNQISK